jgi:O-antigen/teichoic acid export membrane protein/O-antigen ligase
VICGYGGQSLFASARAQSTQARRAAVRLRARSLPGLRLDTVIQTVAARVGASVFSLGASIIAARTLGLYGRGQLAVLIAVPGVIGIMGLLGLDTANLRFAGQSHSAFRQVVWRALVFALAVGTAMAAAWWLAGLQWPLLRLGLDPRMALLSASLCPASLLLTLLGNAEIGRGRMAVYNVVMASTMAVYLAGVTTLLVSGHLTVVACFAVYGGSQVLGIVVLLGLATKRIQGDGEGVPMRQYSSYAVRAYLPNLVQYGMLRMDVPVIQVLAGTTAVALYTVALPFAEALLLLPVAVGLVLFPQVTSGVVNKAAAQKITVAVMIATTALACALAVAAPLVVPVLYGSPYRDSSIVVWAMLPGLIIFSAARTTQTYFFGTDNMRPVLMAAVAGVTAGLVALLVLVSRFGAVGAGIADSVGYAAFAAVILSRLYLAKPIGKGTTEQPLRTFISHALSETRRAVTARGNVWSAVFTSVVIAAAIGCGALSARSTIRTIEVIDALVLLLVIVIPDIGFYILALALPVSQTTFGTKVITAKDLLVLLVVCLIGQLAARRTFPPRLAMVVLGVTLVSYFVGSAALIGGFNVSNRDILGTFTLGGVLLIIPLIAGPHAVTRRTTLLFAFSAVGVALAEISTARSSLASSATISAVNSAATAAGQTGALNHNTEGAFLVLALCILLAYYPRARGGLAKLAIAAGIAVLLTGVAYSFSRASYFGALAVIAVFAVRRSVRGLIGATVAACCLVPLLPATVYARISTVWTNSSLDTSGVVRLDLWSSALRMFLHDPVLGVGYLHFSALLPAYYHNTSTYSTSAINFSGLPYAHNTLLTVLSQTGLLGIALVGTIAVLGWRHAWSATRRGNWAGESSLLAFVGIGICSAFGEPLFEPAVLAAFLIVVMAPRPADGPPRPVPDSQPAVKGDVRGVFIDA